MHPGTIVNTTLQIHLNILFPFHDDYNLLFSLKAELKNYFQDTVF